MKFTRIHSFLNIFFLLTLLALTFSSIGVTPAYAATFTVTKTADTNDGACGADCSLREAITAANAAAGADTISLPAGIYTLTLGSQLPAVSTAIAINGSGAANTFIQANANPNTATYRVFEVTSTGNLTLNNLTVRNGRCNGSCANLAGNGGGIFNAGALIVSNVTFSANSATYGGGMYNNNSSPTLTDVTFSANSTDNTGGGMDNYNSSPTLTNVTFSGNSATYGGGMSNNISSPTLTNVTFSANFATSDGGGMSNYSSNPTLTDVIFSGNSAATNDGGGMANYSSSPALTNVTFSANSAANGGGGMYNTNSNPMLTNVTFSGNSATYYGGGMYNYNSSSPTLKNVTFSGNSASTNGGGMQNANSSPMLTNVTFSANSANTGGGMSNYSNSSPTLKNTLIANSPSGGDCVNNASTLSAASSNNLIEDSANACGLTDGANGDIIGQDPKLGALANNGGLTLTFALLANSPAINKGTNVGGCVGADQRGVARPQGAFCDVGAYEFIFPSYKSQGIYDGWILESTETSSVGGAKDNAAATFILGDGAADKQYRAILSFNTSSLPDNAVITKATLKIRKQGQVGTNPFTLLGGLKVDMKKPYFGADPGLAIGDFQAAAGKVSVATFGATPVLNWYSAVLNLTGRNYINKLGTTQFRLRFFTDDNNDNGADYLKFFSGDSATVSAKPMLIIEYYVP